MKLTLLSFLLFCAITDCALAGNRTSNGGNDEFVLVEAMQTTARESLSQNYPNPFNKSTVITFVSAKQQTVKFAVYDFLGNKLQEQVWTVEAGDNILTFEREGLAVGFYFCGKII